MPSVSVAPCTASSNKTAASSRSRRRALDLRPTSRTISPDLAQSGVAQADAAQGLMRWSVVPPSFRSLLPEAHKSRDSHDIVLLCTRCHEVCRGCFAKLSVGFGKAHGPPASLPDARCSHACFAVQ